ncbi:MAG: DNA mismatch repair protein MutS [Pseudomonadota bacterium]
MMAQYLEIKGRHPGALLFYRMGDFYEMFFEDAVQAASALDIALTKRGKHNGDDIPMCGVPVHAAENYLQTLIRKGFRVAVCEQLEDPSEAKKRGSKSVVKRDVVRLVTPGTLTEDSLLDARRNNYLAAFSVVRDDAALAWVDISTGELCVSECPPVVLGAELARLAPKEVLLNEANIDPLQEIAEEQGCSVSPLAPTSFDSTSASDRLLGQFRVDSLDGFGEFSRAEVSALGAIVAFLELTQKGNMPLLRPPKKQRRGGVLSIDAATRRNLELTRSIAGGRAGSLISVIDRTVTAPGARLLNLRLTSPSTQLSIINSRLDAIEWATSNPAVASALRNVLKGIPDLERAMSRLSLGRGGPRDLSTVKLALINGAELLKTVKNHAPPDQLGRWRKLPDELQKLGVWLEQSLVETPPLLARDGGFIKPEYSGELQEARHLREDGRQIIAQMQSAYSKSTEISALKIKHNNVLGYFVEVTATHAKRMLSEPLSETFIHRQTTANAVRFTTVELSTLETKILNANGRALDIEARIFAELSEAVLEHSNFLGDLSAIIAEFDVATSLADLAVSERWVRPVVSEDRQFKIESGRHPVVEAALKQQNSMFIANSCDLTPDDGAARICLLTGPNMAGKSTFLRQNAIFAILAQLGSFVPAASAQIGVVSQVFSRVGASDDLARGQSTFMVEMVETAAILNQADDRALVILDEIGRGTSTYDGLSIAWATLENLHDVNGCRALFATHYHELTTLSGRLSGLENATVAVKEWEGDVVFLHEVREGAADRSYGVQVAKLAGLPPAVVERARVVLDILEKGDREGGIKPSLLADDLPLFSATPQPPPAPKDEPVKLRLEDINPDQLSPIEALQLIYELKGLLRGGG